MRLQSLCFLAQNENVKFIKKNKNKHKAWKSDKMNKKKKLSFREKQNKNNKKNALAQLECVPDHSSHFLTTKYCLLTVYVIKYK